ncbi:hypothetical protein FXV91_02340 [Methanosarcina sp. DH2]|uniref:hypothetical protein n=1 Tax=Methanosarcina sp. DH2 TaxID=2605639 RepID=UPI001E4794C7|nr:hypothetical protein [Methanosarcina sp. DH2]MCC4769084.1 hypothetical protein [Methanosarcina sp. DH2]
MNTHRISTTISQRHWELLKKHAEKYETQQKALEFALESLEKSSKQIQELTLEEKYWMRLRRAKSLVIIEKTAFKYLIETTDIEFLDKLFSQNKTIEYTIELYFQKSLEECSLNEVIDGLVINLNITNWVDTIEYTDNGGYYKLIITHGLGFAFSKLLATSIENMFKTYGVKAESVVSVKTIFMKILKN